MVTAAELIALLETQELKIVGQLIDSSNGAFVCDLGDIQVVYKPEAEETELWDFPESTLSRREVAASEIDHLLGWNLIPPTVWTEEGEFGPGSVQVFIPDADVKDVEIVPEAEFPSDLLPIVKGEMGGTSVVVGHRADDELFRASVLDAILNNADRKGGHLLRDSDGKLWLIDHGVVLHNEQKLRTVLWGWAGVSVPANIREDLQKLLESVLTAVPVEYFSKDERDAIITRIEDLLEDGLPYPSQDWPAIPWPIY